MEKTRIPNPVNKNRFQFIFRVIICIVWLAGLSCSSTHTNKSRTVDNNGNEIRNLTLKLTYKISHFGTVVDYRMKALIPQTIQGKQKINAITYSTPPDSVGFEGTDKYVYFSLHNFKYSNKIQLSIDASLYKQGEEQVDSLRLNTQALKKYLSAEKYIESNNPSIKKVAESLKKENDLETIVQTYIFVKNHLTYYSDGNPDTVGALSALQKGFGDCSEYSDLFIALLRANKIPARTVRGIFINYWGPNPWHAWAEVYVPKNGWVIFDPSRKHSIVNDGEKFQNVAHSNNYMIFSQERHDPLINKGVHYSYFSYGSNTKQTSVNCSYSINEY